ncbi:hypothetical protein ACQP3F_27710, partial [Escherichia coli]
MVDVVQSCGLGGNEASRACGSAAAVLGADAAVTLATDGAAKAIVGESRVAGAAENSLSSALARFSYTVEQAPG